MEASLFKVQHNSPATDDSFASSSVLQDWLTYYPAGMKFIKGDKTALMVKDRNCVSEVRPDSFKFNLYGRESTFLANINYLGSLKYKELVFDQVMFEMGEQFENSEYKFSWTYDRKEMIPFDTRYAFIEKMETPILPLEITFNGWEHPRYLRGFGALLNMADYIENKICFAPVLVTHTANGFTLFKCIDYTIDYDRVTWKGGNIFDGIYQ